MKGLKKVIVFVLTVTMLVSMFIVPAAAADEFTVDVTSANVYRGADRVEYGIGATVLDDGTIEFKDDSVMQLEHFSFYLPEEAQEGEVFKCHVTGVCKGDFRIWLCRSADQNTSSNQIKASDLGVTDGAFDISFELTASATADEFYFKGPQYGTMIDTLNIKTISYTKGEASAPAVVDEPVVIAPAPAGDAAIPADGVLATANGALSNDALAAAAPGSKIVVEYVWPTGASADVGWGVGGLCFDGWSADPAFEIKIPEGAARDGKLVVEYDLADVLAKGAAQININLYNGIDSYTVTLVQPDAVPTTGDATPVVAIALVAVVALCGMVVVNRKKAYR